MSIGTPRERRAPQSVVGAGLLLLLLVSLLASPTVRAEEEKTTRPTPPLTAFAAGPWRDATLVVVATVESVRLTRGMGLAHVRAESVLKGEAPAGGRITVLVRGPRPTLDRNAPSADYLVEGATGRFIFFLQQKDQGVGYFLDRLVDARGHVGDEKVGVLESHAALERILDGEAKARRTLAFLFDAQTSDGTWTRVHAARELNYFVQRRPDLFDQKSRTALRTLAGESPIAEQRRWLGHVSRFLAGHEVPPAESGPAPPEDPYVSSLEDALAKAPTTAARIQVFERALTQGGARGRTVVLDRLPSEKSAVRVSILRALGERGPRDIVGRIRGFYAMESDPEAQQAIVRAVGLLGGASDVPWLARRATNARVHREVLFALARIRSAEALGLLDAERARAAADGDALDGDDLVALLDYLRGPAFVAVEAQAGRPVGPRDER